MNHPIAVIELAPGRARWIIDALHRCGLPLAKLLVLPVFAKSVELPEHISGVIGSGGPGSATNIHKPSDTNRSLQRGLCLLNTALLRNLPIFGICMSHQLLACQGGYVERHSKGIVSGFESIRILCDDEVFSGVPKDLSLFQFHHDEVLQIPPDWKVIATSKSCAIEAMRMRDRPVWSFQGHPEIPAHFASELLGENSFSNGTLQTRAVLRYDQYRLAIFNNFLKVI